MSVTLDTAVSGLKASSIFDPSTHLKPKGRDELAADSGVEDKGGWGGITLAHNERSPAEVDAVLAAATAAGATIARAGAATFWGGYSGVFIDPDGRP